MTSVVGNVRMGRWFTNSGFSTTFRGRGEERAHGSRAVNGIYSGFHQFPPATYCIIIFSMLTVAKISTVREDSDLIIMSSSSLVLT